MQTIVPRTHKALRDKAKEVPLLEIGSSKIKKIIADMKRALHTEEDGVAIAAPQIGAPLRIFIVAGRAFNLNENLTLGGGENIKNETEVKKTPPLPDVVFINPKITRSSKDSAWMVEGCLSLRWLYGSVKRKKKITVEAYDEKGKKFSRGGSGLFAQIFQHEIDHLEGVLFTDKAKDIEEIPPEVVEKKRYG